MTEEKKDCRKEIKLAYFGGLMDGEGSIGIAKTRDRYQLYVKLGNTDKIMMDWIVREFGGKIRPDNYGNRNKVLYSWQIYGPRAYRLLGVIEDYVMVKRERLVLAREFYHECVGKFPGSRRGDGRPLWMIKKQEGYYERMRKLNKRGNSGRPKKKKEK